MTREEAKQLLPIIQAFAEGKAIQQTDGYDWYDLDDPDFMASGSSYRIKPETKYRPFKNADECWQEMQKHKPFGWIKDTEANEYLNIHCISNSDASIDIFCRMFKRCIFIDESPCGIKVEE